MVDEKIKKRYAEREPLQWKNSFPWIKTVQELTKMKPSPTHYELTLTDLRAWRGWK
jgi:hypothetical protein